MTHNIAAPAVSLQAGARQVGLDGRAFVWSRDGKQIAFQRNASIWVMNADGSNQHSVTASLQISGHPAW